MVRSSPGSPCVPSGDLFLGPLAGIIEDITGGLGGLLQPLAIVMIIACAVLFVASAMSKTAHKYLRAIGMIVAVLFALIIVIILIVTVWGGLNNSGVC